MCNFAISKNAGVIQKNLKVEGYFCNFKNYNFISERENPREN